MADWEIVVENDRNITARHCRIKLIRLKSRPDLVWVIH